MKRTMKSLTALFLAVLMVFFVFPPEVIAYAVNTAESSSVVSEDKPLDLSEVEILSEDISKRGKSEKHFKLSDGSFIVVQYNEPVHYRGDEGDWLEIDNSVSFEAAENTEDFDGYKNAANSFSAKFAENISDAVFSISAPNGENKLKFELISDEMSTTEAIVIDNAASLMSLDKEQSTLQKNEEILSFDKTSPEILYGEVLSDVDFSYTMTAKGVKENIIINRRLDNYEFSFTVESDGLELQLNDDGSITAEDENGEVIYTIPAPFMYDSSDRYSDSVYYELDEKADGRYVLTITANKDWINGSETVFPVTIDPIVNTKDNDISLYSTYVSSAAGDTNYDNQHDMCIGRKSDGSVNRAYVEFYIPNIGRNSVITDAQLLLYKVIHSSTSPVVELHEASDRWTASTLTWNNQPGYGEEIIDYVDTSSENSAGGYMKFDVTRYAVKNKSASVTNGFVLKSADETATGYTSVLGDAAPESIMPYIIVKYRSQLGIEEDFSYITYDDGYDGTAYVNNYTGELTYIKPLVASASDVMPASLSLVYNSSNAFVDFSGANVDRLNTCLYTGMNLSIGWKLTAQQSVVPVEIMDVTLTGQDPEYAYIYIDEDGTEHYFHLDTENTESETYIDDRELGMTLTVDSENSQYKIEFEDGSEKVFAYIRENTMNGYTNDGYIISESDADGNTITYTYSTDDPTQLLKITDPSGTAIVLSYNDRDYLTRVTMGSTTVDINYHPGDVYVPYLLLSVENKRDGAGNENTTDFFYEDLDAMREFSLLRISNTNGSQLEFSYMENNRSLFYKGLKATGVAWKNGESGECSAIYSYDSSFATTVHYTGTDCANCESVESKDDIYYTYTFDKQGNLNLAYAENYDRSIVYSTDVYGYSPMQMNEDSYKLTSYASVGVINENLLGDINDFEGEADVQYSSGVTVTDASALYEYISPRTRRVDFTAEGDKIYFSKALDAGKYCLSFYLNYGTESAVYTLNAKNGNGEIIASIGNISEANNAREEEWARVQLKLELSSAETVTFELVADGASTVYVNHIALGCADNFTPATYNLLSNGGFENGWDGWTSSPAGAFALDTGADVKFGDKAVSTVGSVSDEYTVYKTVDVAGVPTYSFVVSGWAKARSVGLGEEKASFELFAKVKYDYTENGVLLSGETVTRIPFSADTTEWQYASGVVEMPEKDAEWTTFEIKSIDVGAEFGNNCNKVIFDKFALVRDTAVKISYDANGNIESAAVDNEDPYTYEYDENDNLVMIRDQEGNQYRAYTYDAEGNLLSVKDEDNVEIEAYEYDANGKLINSSADGAVTSYGYTAWGTQSSQSVTKTVGDVLYTVSEAYGYNGATKKLESETDSFGNTTAYGYNSDLWLTDITDANGNKTGYTYANGELATQYADVNKNGVCDEGEPVVGYTYDAWGNITAVETETASYTFTYNDANLPLAVYVEGNESPLVTYLYNSTLTESTGVQYANGLTVTYEYDAIGNVSKVLENGVAVAEYEYDSNMNLIGALEDGTETKYCYDEAGTLLYTSKNCNGHTVVTYSETDEETGTTEYITKLDGAEIVYKSVYDEENDISKYVLPNLAEITSDEDELGRTSHIYLKNSAGENILSCTYAYVDKQVGDNLATSEYISSMTYTNGKTYTYTYDAVGNITSVYDGTYTTSYVYDSLYQLVRENNEKLDATWTYTYDTAGNILAKTEYDYTVGELGNATDTVTYTYDSTWGDRLVNYDGTSITYDAQGNPLNWRDGLTFAWNGRELSSITDGTKVYTYEYNADGIRTKTIITDTEDADCLSEYEYVLDDNNNVIAVYKDGAAYGEYYFDESGSPIGYRYNNKNYWYTKNLQGDITRVESEDGEQYVEYDYDAWGNVTVDFSDTRARLAIERVNIYTYRGYIYDRDTGLYYLQSRYYDPVVGRFLNADDTSYLGVTGTTLGYNLYAYCENNVVNKHDYDGYNATRVISNAATATSFLALLIIAIKACSAAGSANFWNPVGWVLLAIAVVVGISAWTLDSYLKNKSLQADLSLINSASTAATPPPPNKGGKGTKTNSKTLYDKNGYRIDVENPGNRPGQIHLHYKGQKYIYNVKDHSFHIGSSNGKLASSSIQKILKDEKVIRAIARGLSILGY